MLVFDIMSKKNSKVQPKESHGGRREGSGRRSIFRGKSASSDNPMYKVVDPWSIRLTPTAFNIGTREINRLNDEAKKNDKPKVSRNVFVEALIRLYGSRISLTQIMSIAD